MMDAPEYKELLRQISELRRETRILRHWLAFIGAGMAILLFLPTGAGLLASGSQRVIEFAVENLGALAAILVLVVVTAVTISGRDRRARHKHTLRRRREKRREPTVPAPTEPLV